jgi:hypothetical protein
MTDDAFIGRTAGRQGVAPRTSKAPRRRPTANDTPASSAKAWPHMNLKTVARWLNNTAVVVQYPGREGLKVLYEGWFREFVLGK